MDYEHLANLLVKRDSTHWKQTGETIFPLLSDKRMLLQYRDVAIIKIV